MADSLENIIYRCIERYMTGRFSERHGLVTSYDPDKYLAKVTFQPEGQQSGWLPIETGHIGKGYGIAIGLQPGSGDPDSGGQGTGSTGGTGGQGTGASGGNASALGDQVIVRFQEADFEGGKIVQRVHSDDDKPPKVKAGEICIWTKFKKDQDPGPDAAQTGGGGQGQRVFFHNDGSISITDGNGASVIFDGKGNVKLNGKKIDVTGEDDITITGKKNMTVDVTKVLTQTGHEAHNLNGKPLNFNGGGPPGVPFSVP